MFISGQMYEACVNRSAAPGTGNPILRRRRLEYADLLPRSVLDSPGYAEPLTAPALTWSILRALCWHIRHVDDWLPGYHPAAKQAHLRRLRKAAKRELVRLAAARQLDMDYSIAANF